MYIGDTPKLLMDLPFGVGTLTFHRSLKPATCVTRLHETALQVNVYSALAKFALSTLRTPLTQPKRMRVDLGADPGLTSLASACQRSTEATSSTSELWWSNYVGS
jgi:hypothetical protein